METSRRFSTGAGTEPLETHPNLKMNYSVVHMFNSLRVGDAFSSDDGLLCGFEQ